MDEKERILKEDLFPVTELPAGARLLEIDAARHGELDELCAHIAEQLTTDHVHTLRATGRISRTCCAIRPPRRVQCWATGSISW